MKTPFSCQNTQENPEKTSPTSPVLAKDTPWRAPNSRADCTNFKPLVAAFVEIALSNSLRTNNATRVARLLAYSRPPVEFTQATCLRLLLDRRFHHRLLGATSRSHILGELRKLNLGKILRRWSASLRCTSPPHAVWLHRAGGQVLC